MKKTDFKEGAKFLLRKGDRFPVTVEWVSKDSGDFSISEGPFFDRRVNVQFRRTGIQMYTSMGGLILLFRNNSF